MWRLHTNIKRNGKSDNISQLREHRRGWESSGALVFGSCHQMLPPGELDETYTSSLIVTFLSLLRWLPLAVSVLHRSGVRLSVSPSVPSCLANVNVLRYVCYMLSAVRLSSVCLSSVCLSVTLVHPTQAVELFGNFFSPYDTQGLYFSGAKNRWWGTPLFLWNLRSKWPTPFQTAQFQPISAHSA